MMTDAQKQPASKQPSSRKPNRFEMAFLFAFHGALTASVLLTYLTGDDVYFLHQFAGYVACLAILLRLLAAALAPKSSPLYLSLPNLFAPRQGGRPAWLKWMAVALIVVTGAAAFSGLLAESMGGFGDLHEGLAEGLLPLVIFAHMAVVLLKPIRRKVSDLRAEDIARVQTIGQGTLRVLGATIAALWGYFTRRLKPYLQASR